MLQSYLLSSLFFFEGSGDHRYLHSFPTRRSSDLLAGGDWPKSLDNAAVHAPGRNRTCDLAHERPHGRADRKSTRLNSSHVRISYAVFCLKKKTNYPTRSQQDSTHTLQSYVFIATI